MQRTIDVKWDSDYERYANYRPSAALLWGKKKIVNSWADLFYDVMLALYQRDTDAFKKMNARYDFGDIFSNVNDPDRATRGLPKDCKSPFLVTKLPTDSILDYIAQAMRWFDLSDDDIKISCTIANSINTGIAPSVAEQMRKNSIEEEKFIKRNKQNNIYNEPNSYSLNSIYRSQSDYIRNDFISSIIERSSNNTNAPSDSINAVADRHQPDPQSVRKRVLWTPDQFRRYLRATPVALSMPNQSPIDVESWSDLFQNICQWLAIVDKTTFFNVFKSQSMIHWIPPKLPYCKMRRPFFIENCRLWIESDRDAPDILDALYYLLRRMGIDLAEVGVWIVE